MATGVSGDESTPMDGPSTDFGDPSDDADLERACNDQQLVVVCGLPGVGKSTVACKVATLVGGDVLRTDAVRKDLYAAPVYTESESRAVYEELLDRAADRLDAGDSIVLDGTFKRRRSRRNARGLARAADVPFRTIKVECEPAVVEARIENRDGLSDADFEIHQQFREEYEPLAVAHSVVDNSGSEAATLEQVDALFQPIDGDSHETESG